MRSVWLATKLAALDPEWVEPVIGGWGPEKRLPSIAGARFAGPAASVADLNYRNLVKAGERPFHAGFSAYGTPLLGGLGGGAIGYGLGSLTKKPALASTAMFLGSTAGMSANTLLQYYNQPYTAILPTLGGAVAGGMLGYKAGKESGNENLYGTLGTLGGAVGGYTLSKLLD